MELCKTKWCMESSRQSSRDDMGQLMLQLLTFNRIHLCPIWNREQTVVFLVNALGSLTSRACRASLPNCSAPDAMLTSCRGAKNLPFVNEKRGDFCRKLPAAANHRRQMRTCCDRPQRFPRHSSVFLMAASQGLGLRGGGSSDEPHHPAE